MKQLPNLFTLLNLFFGCIAIVFILQTNTGIVVLDETGASEVVFPERMAFGALFKKHIDAMLEKPMIIALIMLLGGVVLLFVDKWFQKPAIDKEEEITNKKAFIVGCYQVLSIIFPGLSRSAATIIGGMQQKLSRGAAAEFSFFLAVPTMLAATTYKLFNHYKDTGGFTGEEIKLLALGNLVAFVVAMMAIKFFISFLKKYGFRFWGIYRIIVGIILLVMLYTGSIDA